MRHLIVRRWWITVSVVSGIMMTIALWIYSVPDQGIAALVEPATREALLAILLILWVDTLIVFRLIRENLDDGSQVVQPEPVTIAARQPVSAWCVILDLLLVIVLVPLGTLLGLNCGVFLSVLGVR